MGISVLDLCCGRGGDLFKWKNQDVVHYVGVDLSQALVEEAQRRYNESLKGGQNNYGRFKKPPFKAFFMVNDAGPMQDKNLID